MLGDLTIDYAERLVTLAGRPVQLTATEYQLLFDLSVNAGRVLAHDELLRRAWGPKRQGNLRALRAHLRRLRRKLGEDGSNPTYFFRRAAHRLPDGQGRGGSKGKEEKRVRRVLLRLRVESRGRAPSVRAQVPGSTPGHRRLTRVIAIRAPAAPLPLGRAVIGAGYIGTTPP